MKLLIVDDEPLLRQGIMKGIEKMSLPIDVILQAGNGLEGLSVLAEEKPDIVITDIRMPGMDGLTFIGEAKKVDERLQFIIISGYDEFEFAKKGIQFGVVDYLLKPVEQEELRNSLIQIIAKLDEVRRHSSLSDELRHIRQRSDQRLHEQLLTKLIQQGGDLDVAEKDEKLASLSASCREFMIVLFEITFPPLPYRSFLKGDEALLRFAISNAISQMMDSLGRPGMLFHHSIYEQELIYVLGDCSAREVSAILRELEEIISGVQRYLKLTITIGIGMPVDQVRDLFQSYQQAKLALRDKVIHGKSKVYMSSPVAGIRENRSSILAGEDELFLFRQLNEGNEHAIRSWLACRLNRIVQEEEVHFNQVESFCVELHFLYRKYLYTQISAPEWMIGEIDDLLIWLHGIGGLPEITEKFGGLAKMMIEHMERLRHSSPDDLMAQVKRYMDANLHEPFSLQTIADRFYFHPNYFSRRFKETFKESFVNYLTRVRISKAQQLLKESGLQIQEIAVIVGYPDAAYFSSVFRRATGKTPLQYRMQSGDCL